MSKILYKYKKVDDFKYLLDILLNNRLYAAKYTELNDPMEGYYYYYQNNIGRDLIDNLRNDKAKLRICSLTNDKDNLVMWSHYADNHSGLVIGVELNGKYEPKTVNYLQELKLINFVDNHTAEYILTNKLKLWEHEKEQRIIIDDSEYVTVEIKEIILGNKMPRKNRDLIRAIVSKIKHDNHNIKVSVHN